MLWTTTKSTGGWFQVLFLNCEEEHFKFDLDNATIIPDDVVKLFGVQFASNLNFKNHISHNGKKAGNLLNIQKTTSEIHKHKW